MADKWADYVISAVRYNAADTHIDKVKSHVDNGDTISTPTEVPRATVVSRIEGGDTYATVITGTDGKYTKGAAVTVVTIDGVKYIKTIADQTKKDNLGSLPRF